MSIRAFSLVKCDIFMLQYNHIRAQYGWAEASGTTFQSESSFAEKLNWPLYLLFKFVKRQYQPMPAYLFNSYSCLILDGDVVDVAQLTYPPKRSDDKISCSNLVLQRHCLNTLLFAKAFLTIGYSKRTERTRYIYPSVTENHHDGLYQLQTTKRATSGELLV